MKSYNRNKNRPESSIVEGYVTKECMKFESKFLNGVEISLTWPPRNQQDDAIELIWKLIKNIGHAVSSVTTSCTWSEKAGRHAKIYVI